MRQEKNNFKIKPWHIFTLAVMIIIALVLKISGVFMAHNTSFVFNDREYRLLRADTVEKAFRGLSGREDLGDYAGMLFIFNKPSYYVMVMREMNFPIDIVWLQDGVVVDIAPNAEPEPGVLERYLKEYRPRLPANRVLELQAGLAEQMGLKIGDKIQLFE